MTGVWQTLIPETPSTEPIASPLEGRGLIPSSPQRSMGATGNHVTGTGRGRQGQQGGGGGGGSSFPFTTDLGVEDGIGGGDRGRGHRGEYVGVSTISGGGGDSLHHRLVNHNNNNSHPNHPHLLTKTNSRTSNSIKNPAMSRFPSMPCGEQLWKFYSNHVQNKKKKESRRRVLLKNGLRNLCQINVREKPRRYWNDMFTTLVDARWRWTLFVFSFSYVMSWICFSFVWWVIVTAHDDLNHFEERGWKPCVEGVSNFASIFLFSVETQHTIGYGYHRMTPECPDAIVVLCLQSIAGVLIEALMVGVVFAKLSRPKKRSQTLVFSNKAVICLRDGQLYLMFRVGDIRKSHILEAHVRAQVITKRTTSEGEVLPIHQEEIKVGGYGEDEDRILLFWPTTIVHPIDSESPLYEMSASDLLKAKLEIMVIMEGVVESTGMTTQARTSFLPSEILWGHRFHSTTSYKSDFGHHTVDFSLFNQTFPVDTPLCSAHHLDTIKQMKADGLTGREILATLTESSVAGSLERNSVSFGMSIANGPTTAPPSSAGAAAAAATTSPHPATKNSMPNGACASFIDVVDPNELYTPPPSFKQQNHVGVLKEAILMSTPDSGRNLNYNISRRNSSSINPNLPNNIPRSRLASPIKAVIGAPGAEYLDNSTDSNNEDEDDEEEEEEEEEEEDDVDDDDDGYVEHTNKGCKRSQHGSSRKESREAMLRAHSNSSSSITSESNV